MQLRHSRKLGSIDFAAGGRATLDLDRVGILERLHLQLQYDLTTGASAMVGPLFQTIARLLRRVEVIIGGRDTVWSVPGEMIAAITETLNGQPAYGMDDTFNLAGGTATTTYTIDLPLEFGLPDGRRPDDTGLDLRRVSQGQLAVTFGQADASDLVTTPNSAAIANVTLNVEGDYIENDDPQAQYLVRSLTSLTQEVTATNAEFDMVMDRKSGNFLRALYLAATDAGAGSDSVINDARLEAGTKVFLHSDPVVIRGRSRRKRKLDSLITGFLDVPLIFDGQGAQMINTAALESDLRMRMDVTKGAGTTQITAVKDEVRPLKQA